MRLLIDLSNNQVHASLKAVRAAGYTGVWHKATEGGAFVDRYFHPRREQAARAGLRFGAYHFAGFSSESDAELEAAHFCSTVGELGRRDLAPVLDLETNTHGLRGRDLVLAARAFNHVVRARLGVWPLFYSYPSFVEDLHADRVIGRGLWLASFGRNDGREHPYRVPAPFHRALAHQFTSRGRVPGVSGLVDISAAPKLRPLLAGGWKGLV